MAVRSHDHARTARRATALRTDCRASRVGDKSTEESESDRARDGL